MYQNYLKKYLDIQVSRNKTLVKYCNDDNVCFIHEYDIGVDKVAEGIAGEIVLSDWVSGVIYSLDNISLTDRVPTFIYLSSEKYATIFKEFLERKNTYSQFYLEPEHGGSRVHVIINKVNHMNINSNSADKITGFQNNDLESNQDTYERYTKAISQFKI